MPREGSLTVSGAVLLGLLGCGRVAERFHVPAIARLTNARLTAAYDPLPERSRLIARSAPGCRAFDSAEALLEARVVDAVLIASQPETHGTLAVQALGAGLPVLIEPPAAVSPEEAEWIREAERIVRLPVMVGFNRRYWEPVERVRRALAGAEEQEPKLSVETVLLTGADAGDPLEALAIHLDLVRHLLDREIATVSARQGSPREIKARVTLYGEGLAVCRVGQADQPQEEIRVRAGNRSYEIRAGSERIWPAAGTGRRALDLLDSAPRRALGSPDGLVRSYERQLEAFLPRVESRGAGPRPGPGTTDGLAALLAIDTVRRSLDEGGAELPVPPTPAA